ncbi:MAG: N-acetyltransferase family protein [Actinomycetota bacterium]
MLIRPAVVADAEQICAIYNPEVLETTVTLDITPRTVEDQRDYIAQRSGGLVALVAEEDGDIVGFGGLSFYRDRAGYRTSVEDSVYVHRDHHGKGVGSAVLAGLIEVAKLHGFHAMFARVVGPQDASVALHERHGFTLVGIERQVARKFGRWHDVALLQLLL